VNNKPTHWRLLKQTREQLRAAQERECLGRTYAALQRQLSDRDQHIGSRQQIIEFLNQQLAEEESVINDL